MTIEQRIDTCAYFVSRSDLSVVFDRYVKNWEWRGDPLVIGYFRSYYYVSEGVIYEIDQTDVTECLTSNSEYIRECKKFLIENPDYDYRSEIKNWRKRKKKEIRWQSFRDFLHDDPLSIVVMILVFVPLVMVVIHFLIKIGVL